MELIMLKWKEAVSKVEDDLFFAQLILAVRFGKFEITEWLLLPFGCRVLQG